jgi:hypothetical protein
VLAAERSPVVAQPHQHDRLVGPEVPKPSLNVERIGETKLFYGSKVLHGQTLSVCETDRGGYHLPVQTKRFLVIASVVLAVITGVAMAHVQKKDDPDDWTDRLDIKNASLSHTDTRLRVGMHSWEDWPTRALGKRTIYFTLDTKGDNQPDFGININKGANGIQCLVTAEPNGEFVADGRPRRDGTSGASCSFKRSDVSAATHKTIRWHASVYNLETFEHDDAPDSGMVRHSI